MRVMGNSSRNVRYVLGQLLTWPSRLVRWLIGPKIFLVGGAIAAAAVVLTLFPSAVGLPYTVHESTIRLGGLALQLLGIGSVAWGICDTRRQFGHPCYLGHLKAWLNRFPRFIRWPTRVDVTVMLQGVTGKGSIGTLKISRPMTTDERVEALEKEMERVHATVGEHWALMLEQVASLDGSLKSEQNTRVEQDQKISARLEAAQTGGLNLSAVGVFWLLVGVTLSTASLELSGWLGG